MKNLLKRVNFFLIIAMLFTYLLGLVLANAQGREVETVYNISGFLFLLGFYLVGVFALPDSPFDEGESKAGRKLRSSRDPRITALLFAIALSFISLYFLIRAHFFEYLLIPSLLIIFASASISLNPSVRSHSLPVRWVLDAFAISPIAFYMGMLITGLEFSFYPFALGLPLFLIATASTIALFFAEYQEDPSLRAARSMQSFSWEKAASLHDLAAVLGYSSLAAYLYLSGSLLIAWPALLLIVAAIAASLLLRRTLLGMHTNWKLLQAIVMLNYIGVVYLLAFAFFTH